MRKYGTLQSPLYTYLQDAHTFVSILHYGDTFSTSTMNKFEDRIAEMAESMSAVELATVRDRA